MMHTFYIFVISVGIAAAFRMRSMSSRTSIRIGMDAKMTLGGANSQVIAAQPTVEDWLAVCEPGLQKAIKAMFSACKEIAYKIRTASCDKMACFNEFGDEQLAIDILANNVIFQNLKSCGAVATASSEENPTEGKHSIVQENFNICAKVC